MRLFFCLFRSILVSPYIGRAYARNAIQVKRQFVAEQWVASADDGRGDAVDMEIVLDVGEKWV